MGTIGRLRSGHTDWRNTALVLVALTWVPCAVLASLHWLSTGSLPLVFYDLSLHARLLIAIPALVAAERVLDWRCAGALDHVRDCHIVADADLARFSAARQKAERLRARDSIDLALAVVAWGLAFAWLGNWIPNASAAQPTPARLYYGLVGLPLAHWLLLRGLWRWALWVRQLWGLSRLRLHLMPTHPDHAGGLVHLADPALGFALIMFAVASITSGTAASAILWDEEVLNTHVILSQHSVAAVAAALAGLAEFMALGPLLLFLPQMQQARVRGMHEYHALAMTVTRTFHERWIGRSDHSLVERGEISSMADLGTMYANLRGMRLLAFDRLHVVGVLVGALGPMAPLALLVVPLPELLKSVGEALLG